MSMRARGPAVLKGAFVTIWPDNLQPQIVPFTYNPSSLKRSLKPKIVGTDEDDRSEASRFTGAPVQTITVAIEIDVTDQLQAGDPVAVRFGALPQLSALELLVYPTPVQVGRDQSRMAAGALEAIPLTAPRTLFVWGKKRVLPVELSSYDITEEMFDGNLNPIRATLTLAMRVLTYSDLDDSNPEYHEFMTYQNNLIAMASRLPSVDSASLIGVDPGSL